MKSSLSKKNITLIRMMVLIFIILLAVYIPLKIHINRDQGTRPVEQTVSFEILITRDLACTLTGPAGCGYGPEKISEMIGGEKAGEGLMLIDYSGITARKLENTDISGQTAGRLKKIGYHAVAPVILEAKSLKLLSSPSPLFRLPLPLTSANIIPQRDREHNLSQWIITPVSSSLQGAEGRREIRVGIFSLSFVDSIQAEYDRFKAYNLIKPKIAALEVINRLKRKGCHLIIAACGSGYAERTGTLPGVDIILEGSEKCLFRSGNEFLAAGQGRGESSPGHFRVYYSSDSLRIENLKI